MSRPNRMSDPRRRRHALPRPRAAALFLPLLGIVVAGPAHAVIPPRHGSTLIVAARGPVGTLDPARASTTAERDLCALLFDRLVAEAPDGTVVGAAAESWSANADSTEWTFRLRDDLRFSKGRPVRARDFEESFARLRASAPSGSQGRLASALSARAVNDRTLVVEIDRRSPGATLAALSDPIFSVVQVVTGDGGESLVGSGPFRFVGQADGGFVLLPRLDHPLGRPAPARVVVSPYADDAAGDRLIAGLAVIRHDESKRGRTVLALDDYARGVFRTSRGVLDLTSAFLLR
jgi:peptide/nickel transport system substrate-binding protein